MPKVIVRMLRAYNGRTKKRVDISVAIKISSLNTVNIGVSKKCLDQMLIFINGYCLEMINKDYAVD